MTATVTQVEAFIVSLPRDVPYLGPLAADEKVNTKGYFVRKGNRTVYPTTDMSVLVKATASDGTIGWGETYGIAAPQAVVALIDELLAPFIIDRDPYEAATIWQDLYDMQRVRGASGGAWHRHRPHGRSALEVQRKGGARACPGAGAVSPALHRGALRAGGHRRARGGHCRIAGPDRCGRGMAQPLRSKTALRQCAHRS